MKKKRYTIYWTTCEERHFDSFLKKWKEIPLLRIGVTRRFASFNIPLFLFFGGEPSRRNHRSGASALIGGRDFGGVGFDFCGSQEIHVVGHYGQALVKPHNRPIITIEACGVSDGNFTHRFPFLRKTRTRKVTSIIFVRRDREGSCIGCS